MDIALSQSSYHQSQHLVLVVMFLQLWEERDALKEALWLDHRLLTPLLSLMLIKSLTQFLRFLARLALHTKLLMVLVTLDNVSHQIDSMISLNQAWISLP
jgi:hypothetical protein